ncbi:MAG: GIY-YIG nuclease family protein [Acidobacteria bacterium]|nr:GIY-YIG nuclease family protein [Acidobacteriota bacterium]
MAAKTYTLNFDGYWRAPNISGLPANSGIYCAYTCRHNRQENTVSIRKLLYIGEAANVRDRVSGHERWEDWKRHLLPGEELCFNAALIAPDSDRQRAEAAMIFHHKPPCNVEYVHVFPYDQTTISTSGRNALLDGYFTVYPTPQQSGLGTLLGGTTRWPR